MSNYIEKWLVSSNSNPDKNYTVSRAADGAFACSCPAWTFRRKRCKHICSAVENLIGVKIAEKAVVDKLRFVSKINGIVISCENCSGCDGQGRILKMLAAEDILYSKEMKPFYILGRCCENYERKKD